MMPSAAPTDGLIGPQDIPAHLARRGVLPVQVPCLVEELSGGVSGFTVRVTAGSRSVVVKQSLARLRVQDEWTASRERVLVEAEGLRAWARVAPGRVPAVLDVDPESFVLVTQAAPEGWEDLKSRLLTGRVDPEVGGWLGGLLRAVQGAPVDLDPSMGPVMSEGFRTLRVEPYLVAAARRLPHLAVPLLGLSEELARAADVMVHGDFSPKNVLVGGAGEGWVIDHEVSHVGDPRFDAAFMLSHLHAKAVHDAGAAAGLDQLADVFVQAWDPTGEVRSRFPLSPVVGALLAARAAGRSGLDYWSDSHRAHALRLAERLLTSPAVEERTVTTWREEAR